ncbi:MAG: hypothetical protein MI861_27985 [Pirellulales bacterium]|nr:hypothetical protein [Pirellulales bacterium]
MAIDYEHEHRDAEHEHEHEHEREPKPSRALEDGLRGFSKRINHPSPMTATDNA